MPSGVLSEEKLYHWAEWRAGHCKSSGQMAENGYIMLENHLSDDVLQMMLKF